MRDPLVIDGAARYPQLPELSPIWSAGQGGDMGIWGHGVESNMGLQWRPARRLMPP